MFPPTTWTEDEILQLIENGQEEFIELDFKRSDSLKSSEPNKNEISKDISAFANTIGGTIIYGIEEDKDPPHKAINLSPIDPRTTSKEWLGQVIDSRIQPRIPGIRIHSVDLPKRAPGFVVYAVTIPEGATAYQAADQKYYKRSNFQSLPMLDYEIRQILNRVSRPFYSVWLKLARLLGKKMGISFRTIVVNNSEVTAHDPNALLYFVIGVMRIS